MPLYLQEAETEDLTFLEFLEHQCFPPERWCRRHSLRRSIRSPRQLVFLLMQQHHNTGIPIGAAIVWVHRLTMRIYSIAVLPEFQNRGGGHFLMRELSQLALDKGCHHLSLEADAYNQSLIRWYQSHGFEIKKHLPLYYGVGTQGIRMVKKLQIPAAVPQLKTWTFNYVILDDPKAWIFNIPQVQVLSAEQYLSGNPASRTDRTQVVNLCHSYKPNRVGYYVSLLAAARNHKVMPNVTTLQDFSNIRVIRNISEEISSEIESCLNQQQQSQVEIDIFFGYATDPAYADLAQKLHELFEMPLFRVIFRYSNRKWAIFKVQQLTFRNVLKQQKDMLESMIQRYFQRKRFRRSRFKPIRYDLAILCDPLDPTAPSNPQAIQLFRHAGEQLGFYVEIIEPRDQHRIAEFDALLIRATTSVSNITYKFARTAYAEGLVVIDDPWSILRCSNKMFLYERMARSRVRQPRSRLISKRSVNLEQIKRFHFPLVLKLPDSCFSLGVFKVNSPEEMYERLQLMFESSDVIIAQEFLQSSFDWRIGLMDGKPLFACKYHMANNHWQIYNWNRKDDMDAYAGDSETIPLEQVPSQVLHTASKAASLIGDGLYGVDLKEIHGKTYVIEINDNPNIDHGIEDALAGDALYQTIVRSLLNRIEKERNLPRYISYRK